MTALLPRTVLSWRPVGVRPWVLTGLVLLSTSCAPDLPTAPDSSRSVIVGTGIDDGYAEEIVVVLVPGENPARLAQDHGAQIVDMQEGYVVLRPINGDIEFIRYSVANDPRVLSVELNTFLETAESRQQSFAFDDGRGWTVSYAEQPAREAIGLSLAHRASVGENVLVAILDTGADLTHPDLASRIEGGHDFVSNDTDPMEISEGDDSDGDGLLSEAHGHGTHVAGIVALAAPAARFLIVRVLDSNGRGDIQGVAAGIRWATRHGARVINLSLGMLHASTSIRMALDEARERGVVCVASAGNWGAEYPTEYPACIPGVIAVAAMNANADPASFTSFGDHIAICAPGMGIRSTYPDGMYRLWNGTSMAAPFVSGAAALLLAVHPEWNTDAVLDRLEQTAGPMHLAGGIYEGRLGAGALDVGAALASDLLPGGTPWESNPILGRRP